MVSVLRNTSSAVLVVIALASGATGCVISARPAAAVVTYEPVYYEGNMVFYDDHGLPYYYTDGVVYYVPRTSPQFNVYVGHYGRYRTSYRRWYQTEGHVYVHRHRSSRPQHPGPRVRHRPYRR